jgi:hypothetical protein
MVSKAWPLALRNPPAERRIVRRHGDPPNHEGGEEELDFRRCADAKKKREPGRRGGPGSLRRRKDVLSASKLTYKSIIGKRFILMLKIFFAVFSHLHLYNNCGNLNSI